MWFLIITTFKFVQILDELKSHKSFLSFFDDIELELSNLFESLHILLKMFERKHCKLVKNQLNRYSTELDKILKQMSDHMMLYEKDIETFPDVVTSHFTVLLMKNINTLFNINLLIHSLNILTSVDIKPKESWAEFIQKFLLKLYS